MESLQLKNPLTNGRIVSVDTPLADYLSNGQKRGQRDYEITRSDLIEISACPLKWRLGGTEEEATDSQIWGSLVDVLVTSPEQFANRFMIHPETYRDSKGEEKPWTLRSNSCKAWVDKYDDMMVIGNHLANEAHLAANRIRTHPDVRPYLEAYQAQVMIRAEYRAHNGIVIPVKALIDLAPDKDGPMARCLVDLKTARNGSARTWPRVVNDCGYDVQAAFYLDCWNAATMRDSSELRYEFRHIVSENVPPYIVGRRILSAEFVELGRARYIAALKTYAAALQSDQWPDYETDESLDGWSLTEPEAWMMR